MAKILISVEGDTEQLFVTNILAPHLARFNVFIVPSIVETKRVQGGTNFKGGVTSYAKVRRHVMRLLSDSSANLVTTLYDFYGLPSDFPENAMPLQGSYQSRVRHLTQAFQNDVQHPRFTPFFAVHEFEALLFADTQAIAQAFPDEDESLIGALNQIVATVETPEAINLDMPPAKRLSALIKGYNKPFFGYYIASEIGLDRIREHCPHFDAWVKHLENLGQ